MVSSEELGLIRSDFTSIKETPTPVPWIKLVRLPQSWSFIAAKFLTDPVWFFLLFRLPNYFKKTRYLDTKLSLSYLIIAYALFNVIKLIGGYFPGYLLRCGWSGTRARKTALIAYALLILPVLAV